jgi:hypothetical protein
LLDQSLVALLRAMQRLLASDAELRQQSTNCQMMMAWKVSGLSDRPAIIASRPASMRLAMAISPSRDKSSTEPISRRYMRRVTRSASAAHVPLHGKAV